jgi:hypothetical protein
MYAYCDNCDVFARIYLWPMWVAPVTSEVYWQWPKTGRDVRSLSGWMMTLSRRVPPDGCTAGWRFPIQSHTRAEAYVFMESACYCVQFEPKLECVERFFYNSQTSDFMEIRWSRSRVFACGGRTDRRGEANRRMLQTHLAPVLKTVNLNFHNGISSTPVKLSWLVASLVRDITFHH